MTSRYHEPLGIIVTGDIFRPTETRFISSQAGNIRWFHTLVRGALGRATGQTVDVLTWPGPIDIGRFYDVAGADRTMRGWSDLFDRRRLPPELEDVIALNFSRNLVVGFEMPRMLYMALDRLDIPYINVTIHPVRFLSDIYFGMATNRPEVFAALTHHAIAERDIERGAELTLAHVAKEDRSDLGDVDTLILGQTDHDRALISNGRFVSFIDYADALQTHLAGNGEVLFKRHPYSNGDLGLHLAGVPLLRIRSTQDNFYSLMGVDGIEKVISITSGGTFEARYFGKTPIHLGVMQSCCVEPGASWNPEAHLGIFEGFLDEDFWRSVCAPLMSVTAPDGYRYRRPPNTLRVALGEFWGLNQITTDRIVAQSSRKR